MGGACPARSFPVSCVGSWAQAGLGGHPQLQPNRVGPGGRPRAPFRPRLGSEQLWAGSELEGPTRPARRVGRTCRREAVGASICVRRAGGAPMGLPGQTSPAESPSPRQPCQLPGAWGVGGTSLLLESPQGLQAACLCWGPLPSPPAPGPGSLTLCRSCPSAPFCPPAARHPWGPDSCQPGHCARRPHGRCDPGPWWLSPRTRGSSQLVLRVAAARSLVTSGQSPAFLQMLVWRPQHQLPVLRLLKLGHQLGGKKNLPD